MLNLLSKKALIVLFIPFYAIVTFGQGVIRTPRIPSPAATISQTIGISTVVLNYSRPSVKGREIWGNLVPYGYNIQGFGAGKEAPWRAGANENTVITFSDPVQVEGQLVPAGSYGLFFVINKDNSGEVILSKDYRSWGSFWYDPKDDQLRAKINVRENSPTELLTYDFINLSKTSAELVLNWEKKQFPVKIEYDVDKIVMSNAAEELKGVVGFSWQGYTSAAAYALANKINYDQAIKWTDNALAQTRNFTILMLKANLLEASGKTDEVEKLKNEALSISTEAEMNNYGYQLINEKKFDKAIEIFKLNAQRHPSSANVWDSLGEAYFDKGDKKNAIVNLKKSLDSNPPANVKLNSEKLLKELGAL